MENYPFELIDDSDEIDIPIELSVEPPRTVTCDEFFEEGTQHRAVVVYGGKYEDIGREPKLEDKKYEFELDFFQKISICAVERNESVLVAAHTSCGKTVVAEYAIAQSLSRKQRVIYTSPIKALSNQKFRELKSEFEDVGLMTGDVTINPSASCLVMTTEILRNMLYKGSEVIKEVQWVIFDEIHYMRDKDRGVVWEETLILLGREVRMIFLSATIPNALEFAEWVCFISGNPIHVVYTTKRVIPLHHYLYSDKLYLIKDDKKHIRNYREALNSPISRKDMPKKLWKLLEKINTPAVVFSFSRIECEFYASSIKSDFNTEKNKKLVQKVFRNAIQSLREEDQNIPMIKRILPLLESGIGIHHSGLLPIVREIVELLFQESLLKVLFATETFSIGLNMPAKTVIFTTLVKFDGITKRALTSGEYIQMSGRAGRRGLDDKGVAISMVDQNVSDKGVSFIFEESRDNLDSAFRLTYNMVLNLTRVEGLNPKYLLSRSFSNFQAYKKALKQEADILEKIRKTRIESKINLINDSNVNKKSIFEDGKNGVNNNSNYSVGEIYKLLVKREKLIMDANKELVSECWDLISEKGRVVDLMIPRHGAPLFVENMIVKGFVNKNQEKDACKISSIQNKKVKLKELNGEETFNLDDNIMLGGFVLTNSDIKYVEYLPTYVTKIYAARCKPKFKAFSSKFQPLLRKRGSSDQISNDIIAIEKRIQEAIPEINFRDCFICGKPARVCLVSCVPIIHKNPLLQAIANKIIFKENEVETKKKLAELHKLKEIYHMTELNKMLSVLKRLNYIDDTSVLIKGKLAAEITIGHELVITELICDASFISLPLSDMLSLLSCFVADDKVKFTEISENNSKLYKLIEKAVTVVCNAMNAANITLTTREYLSLLSNSMMEIVRMWINGSTFINICQKSVNYYEGSIIRTLKRLEELLRQLVSAATLIGNTELADILAQGIFVLKRDIIFTNSLYF